MCVCLCVRVCVCVCVCVRIGVGVCVCVFKKRMAPLDGLTSSPCITVGEQLAVDVQSMHRLLRLPRLLHRPVDLRGDGQSWTLRVCPRYDVAWRHTPPSLRPKLPFTGLSGPSGPKSPKSLKKGLLGVRRRSPRKYPKKSENMYFRGLFWGHQKKTLFETTLLASLRPDGPETPVNGGSGRSLILLTHLTGAPFLGLKPPSFSSTVGDKGAWGGHLAHTQKFRCC